MKLDLHSVAYALGIAIVVSPVPPEHIRHPEVLRPDSAVGFQHAKRSRRRLLHAINSNAVIEIIQTTSVVAPMAGIKDGTNHKSFEGIIEPIRTQLQCCHSACASTNKPSWEFTPLVKIKSP